MIIKRYYATAPSGLHPLGCGGHRAPPAAHACLRRVGGLDARQAAGRLTRHTRAPQPCGAIVCPHCRMLYCGYPQR